ncbi:MAG: serine O-acetyltransferase [Niabella sp.]
MEKGFIKKLLQREEPSCFTGMPDKRLVAGFLDELFEFLFLSPDIRRKNEVQLENAFFALKNKFATLVYDVLGTEVAANQVCTAFFESLPGIYDQLLDDAKSIVRFDPAARCLDEVLVAYPGFYATAVYRFSHLLHVHQVYILARLLSEHAHSKTGIDIHPGAQIGQSFFIDHGTGIVIGETTIIGENVKIYQGVTLGALNVGKELAKVKRHPTIEDNVIIYAGSTILGGETVIGRDSIIGGNVWLTNSVPSNSVVYHKSQVFVKDMIPPEEPVLNFVI